MSSSSNSLAAQYQKLTDKEHILVRPETYLGSVENTMAPMYIFKEGKVVSEEITYNPALFKMFDEGVVNCRDHVVRMAHRIAGGDTTAEPVTNIEVSVEGNRITMLNNGDGIDVEKHPVYGTWIPELIFGHLRTSTNYGSKDSAAAADTSAKITGGKNGFGFKLVLIWSKWGKIETYDARRHLKYTQVFENNLDVIHPPTITEVKPTAKRPAKAYTSISFEPDYERLKMPEGLTPAMVALFKRRVYDVAGVTTKDVKVKFNHEVVPVKDFPHYVSLYTDAEKVVETSEGGGGWSYAVALGDEFKQVSFVNGIFTYKGGKHVEYITQQIVRKMCALILKKKKVTVKPFLVHNQLQVFLNCTIENPSFDSQSKDYLTTPVGKFGSTCEVSDKFVERLAALGVMNNAVDMTVLKEMKDSKRTDGAKTKTLRGVPKLVDANHAGTKRSNECTLILCEGDSAKAGIISGLTSTDRDFIGVYPMKGKLLNVRGESLKKINDNVEITELKKILGLETGKVYKNVDTLRYGRVLFMTDQDLDGSHIKGLCINLFECLWPSLLALPNFLGFMNTPILKATKGKTVVSFYNDAEYEQWRHTTADAGSWKVKYYKGLGTSTGDEFKEYFKQRQRATVFFTFEAPPHEGQEEPPTKKAKRDEPRDDDDEKEEEAPKEQGCGDEDVVVAAASVEDDEAKKVKCLDLLFNKKLADARKQWLMNYDRNAHVDTRMQTLSLRDFTYLEMIHFSKYDCDRSIANLMDGLKVSQRKILFSAFLKNLVHEIKVAQFSGYVSENSGYHHGEASLNGAIVNMAQEFVGSNNINLFFPSGQFGTRLEGGKDSGSVRYIYTRLQKITRLIFNKKDDPVLDYLNDDGVQVEPVYYAPILPMVLVNGCKGIGTGFSTEIPCYHPKQVIAYIMQRLAPGSGGGGAPNHFVPFYKGFKGKIEPETPTRYITKGTYTLHKNTLDITELPIGTWSQDYKHFLEKLDDDGVITSLQDLCTDTLVHFRVNLKKDTKDTAAETMDIMKTFKLTSYLSISNMNLFNAQEQLTHYTSVPEIIDDFMKTRLALYQKRKDHELKILAQQLTLLENKVKYITELLNGTLDLRKKNHGQIVKALGDKQFQLHDGSYNYLIKMPMDSVCEENVATLNHEHQSKKREHAELEATAIETIWTRELVELSAAIDF